MGMLMRATTVLATVLASTVVVGATTTPAAARVVPCTQTFYGSGNGSTTGPYNQFATGTVLVDQSSWAEPYALVTDVDVTVVIDNVQSYGEPVSVEARLLNSYAETRLFAYEATDEPQIGLQLDDEADPRPRDAVWGRWAPDGFLGAFDGRPAAGDLWKIEVRSPSYAGGANGRWRVQSIELTITSTGCDSDGDGIVEHRDNCASVVNPDQRDLDGDRTGDACDPDDDNDGVADTGDNCPGTVNADQTDWDGDRIGNACDSTPGTAPVAPVPTPTPTPTPTPVPTTNPVPPTTGCTDSCAYVRTVELRHRAKRHRFQGTVASVADGCRSSVPVTIWRKRSGADRKLLVVTTRASGAFRTRAPRAPGRYYATVGSAAEPLCGTDRSRVVRVRR